MRMLLGLILILVGLVIGGYGVYTALSPMLGLYSSTLDDPLNEGGARETSKTEVRDQMLEGVVIGAVGVVPIAVGTVLWKVGMVKSLKARFKS